MIEWLRLDVPRPWKRLNDTDPNNDIFTSSESNYMIRVEPTEKPANRRKKVYGATTTYYLVTVHLREQVIEKNAVVKSYLKRNLKSFMKYYEDSVDDADVDKMKSFMENNEKEVVFFDDVKDEILKIAWKLSFDGIVELIPAIPKINGHCRYYGGTGLQDNIVYFYGFKFTGGTVVKT